MILPSPAVRTNGQPTADHLAEGREVGRYTVARLRAAGVDAEAGHDLVKQKECSGVPRETAKPLQESGPRRHEPHVARDGFDNDGRDVFADQAPRKIQLERARCAVAGPAGCGLLHRRHHSRVRVPEDEGPTKVRSRL